MEYLLETAERAEPVPTQREMSTDAINHATHFRIVNSKNQEFDIWRERVNGAQGSIPVTEKRSAAKLI